MPLTDVALASLGPLLELPVSRVLGSHWKPALRGGARAAAAVPGGA